VGAKARGGGWWCPRWVLRWESCCVGCRDLRLTWWCGNGAPLRVQLIDWKRSVYGSGAYILLDWAWGSETVTFSIGCFLRDSLQTNVVREVVGWTRCPLLRGVESLAKSAETEGYVFRKSSIPATNSALNKSREFE